MRIDSLSNTEQMTIPKDPVPSTAQEFPEILLAKLSRSPGNQSPPSFPLKNHPNPAANGTAKMVLLGTISKMTPTVYNILQQHNEYADRWPSLIYSELNRQLPYKTLSEGTDVYLDQKTGALKLEKPSPEQFRSLDILPAQTPSKIIKTEPASKESQPDGKTQSHLSLGKISDAYPTVSHLLLEHPEIRNDAWEILGYDVNKDKRFREITAGTEIFLDRHSGEIIWSNQSESLTAGPENQKHIAANGLPSPLPIVNESEAEPISLGKISPQSPTVSHLLIKDNLLRSHTWNIIFSPLNKDKPYSLLQSGTEIFLKPGTGELSWEENPIPAPQPMAAVSQSEEAVKKTAAADPPMQRQANESFSTALAKAVRPYFGRPYNEINCYGLVVRGLRRMGVRYLGPGGVRERLVQMAMDKNMPPNAYFNGEGIIEAAGEKVYSKTLQQVRHVEKETEILVEEMRPNLKEGDILSFSMPSSGHTGIISRSNGQWTFINSGDIDNPIESTLRTKGVGEEALFGEIKNWLQKAHAENQSLQITLGRLQEEKLRTAMHQQLAPVLSSTL